MTGAFSKRHSFWLQRNKSAPKFQLFTEITLQLVTLWELSLCKVTTDFFPITVQVLESLLLSWRDKAQAWDERGSKLNPWQHRLPCLLLPPLHHPGGPGPLTTMEEALPTPIKCFKLNFTAADKHEFLCGGTKKQTVNSRYFSGYCNMTNGKLRKLGILLIRQNKSDQKKLKRTGWVLCRKGEGGLAGGETG